jgi:hypothetical protein
MQNGTLRAMQSNPGFSTVCRANGDNAPGVPGARGLVIVGSLVILNTRDAILCAVKKQNMEGLDPSRHDVEGYVLES